MGVMDDKEDLPEQIEVVGVNGTTTTGINDNDNDLTLRQAAKKYRRVLWYCIGLTSAILLYGYDYVIVGSVSAMPSFQYVT
jgi:hypothetical protein